MRYNLTFMAKQTDVKTTLGKTDIYLIDQILKNRYQKGALILDAGCGKGRNLHWFYHNGFTIYGLYKGSENIETIKSKYPEFSTNFSVSTIENNDFNTHFFDHIICNAVLHFASDKNHFFEMFSSLFRLLKPNGSLFIRMASNLVLNDTMVAISNGRYLLPDGTKRFLLTKKLLNMIHKTHRFSFLEPIKTTNVNDVRSMTTLVIKKE